MTLCTYCGADLGDEPDYQEANHRQSVWYNAWWCPFCNDPVLDYANPMIYDEIHGELIAQDPAKRPGYIERAKEQMEFWPLTQ